MSSPLAVAAVTAVLQSFLQNSVSKYGLEGILNATIKVSAEAPDRILNGNASPDCLNLFLFQAIENQGWRNVCQPTRNATGDRISNPPLALDLSYLLTAYGSADLHAEVLLGYAMSVFHEMPIFTRDAIRAAIPTPPPSTLPNALTSADLADQIEQIKIVPQVMSVEEISKIWSALQSQYRPTAVYKVTVVLIESVQPITPGLPVRARNLLVLPFESPAIEQIESQATDSAPIIPGQQIFAGYNLVIVGQQLKSDTTLVYIDDESITPASDEITDTQIIVPLPADLEPGLHSVQIAQPIAFDPSQPNDTRRGIESNIASFVLTPQITTPSYSTAPNSTLSLDVAPAVGSGQRVALLVGGNTISIPPRPAADPPTETLLFPIPDLAAGDYLLRVQIDGAESPLALDASGNYASPKLTIT
jgi:hypothetical protein